MDSGGAATGATFSARVIDGAIKKAGITST